MKKMIFPQWPFPKGSKTTIHWIMSPVLKTDKDSQRQWMLNVAVKDESGAIQFVPAQWGMITCLKIGMEVIDGKIDTKQESVNGRPYEVNLENDGCYHINGAVYSITRNTYILKEKPLFDELCFVFKSGKKKIVVPCIELIRFVFGLNKWLAQCLMELDAFSNYVQGSISEEKIRLEFTSNVSVSAIRKEKVLQTISQCLFNNQWSNAWTSVFARRINKGTSDSYIPIDMIPPKSLYVNSQWNIIGIKQNEYYFVYEIKDIVFNEPYPFNEIRYSHPKLLFSPKKEGRRIKKGIHIKENSKGENYVDQTPASPKNTKSPVNIEVKPTGILYPNPVLIQAEYIENPSGTGQRIAPAIQTNNVKTTLLSFNAEASLGQVQAAEFVSWDDIKSPIPGFESFFLAITELKKIVNAIVEVSYTSGVAPETSPLTQFNEGDKYILVKCTHPLINAYILEVEQIKNLGLSTLIFSSEKEVMETVNDLLKNYLSKNRSWRKNTFKKYEGVILECAKHSSVDSELWALRLRNKIRLITSIIDF